MRISEIQSYSNKIKIDDINSIAYDSEDDAKFFKDKDPNIGPHEGKIINLMLAGLKPAALLSIRPTNALPYIKDGRIKVIGKIKQGYIVTIPGEEWRGKQLLKIWPKLSRASGQDKLKIHAKIGLLLGYPKEAIKKFLDNQIRNSI